MNKEIEVHGLSWDGNSWFVENCTDVDEARKHVADWVNELYAVAHYREEALEHLSHRSTAEVKKVWFATGHYEGEMVSDEEPPVWITGVLVR